MFGVLHSHGGVPIGSVCAYVGQLQPGSQKPNRVWGSQACAPQSTSAPPPADQPVTLIEVEQWMLCDGRSLEAAKYPELFGVLGYLYGEGDAGTGTFRIPDCRGLFLRGVDNGSGMDPEAAGRYGPTGKEHGSGVGSLQCDALQTHTHKYNSSKFTATSQGNVTGAIPPADVTETQAPTDPPARVSPSETRPKNIAVHYIIRYR